MARQLAGPAETESGIGPTGRWGDSGEQVTRSGLREQISDKILTAVFDKRFRSGERLQVNRLSAMYGASPTPVRESLVELAGLDIVALLPNRGAVVQPFGPRQVAEMSQVRRALETESVRCAHGRIPRPALKELHARLSELHRLPPDDSRDRRARVVDTQLHALICEHSGNSRLAAEIRRYLVLFRALRNVSHSRDSLNAYRHSNDVPEHLKIVDALIKGTTAQAARAMDEHIRMVERRLVMNVFATPE